jgi:hypothetical protein
VLAGLFDHELGAAAIEHEGDAPALGVMQRTQCLRKLGAGGVLVACGQGLQVGPGVEDVRAIDEKVFFKSHGASLPRARKLDKPGVSRSVLENHRRGGRVVYRGGLENH